MEVSSRDKHLPDLFRGLYFGEYPPPPTPPTCSTTKKGKMEKRKKRQGKIKYYLEVFFMYIFS
jgi:hypothetical protein